MLAADPTSRRLWMKRGCALFASAAAALVLLEFLTRLFVFVPRGTPYVAENPDTIYFNKPDIHGRHHSPGEFDYAFHTNSHGLRSPEIDHARTPARRILCLGDSFTFGIGVADDQTWPAQLGKALNTPTGNRLEVLNAGVMGWGLAEYLVWLQLEGCRYHPDLIVVGVHASDWENALNGLLTLDSQGALVRHQVVRKDVGVLKKIVGCIPFYNLLMTRSALANLIKQRVVQFTKRGANLAPTAATTTKPEDPFLQTAAINQKILAELLRLSREIKAQILFVYIPKFQALHPESDTDVSSRLFHESLLKWMDELHFNLLDATPVFQRALARDHLEAGALYHLKDGHCKERGYAVLANSAADYLRQHPDLLSPP